MAGGLEAFFFFFFFLLSRLKTKTDKNRTKDNLTVSLCFTYGSICCRGCGDSFLKDGPQTFSENMEEGCSRRGAVCFQSLVLFTLLLYVCTAKPSKTPAQNIWSLTELLCLTAVRHIFSLGRAALSNMSAQKKACVVCVRCAETALNINLFPFSHVNRGRKKQALFQHKISSMWKT